ncbi:AmmeMemoRadiSam system radical SAM enzyme [Candidatus Saganbacteria bacterium CG08_land_8_20_14_0_20_45_16]|uniref:AmmeMemoRadiSam system radical SAM enzyme n=1 Tax=Candidatus Saganbacteria bacterium CG08_land_8_20_14_0_20_45_16 TaxID=2014293 RepID=A0A2H0Y0A8_UNCSA|nr:MAG: AmmeMemoRadiSam system radical SAM enzyme [Candidatus Saganbacteria bacterium CG08_land_8_20_14_0_20_45_16]
MNQLKVASFYTQLDNQKVKCTLCPWNCLIKEGRCGVCGVRENRQGKLYSLVYGKPCSVAADPIEKKPLFHFYPGTLVLSLGTYGCNMCCGHCQNWQIAHVGEGPTQEIPPERLVSLAIENDCQGIAWTYNEPTIWFEYVLDSAKIAKAAGLYTAFVTNGYINQEPLDMLAPYLDAYRVDVKGFTNDFYFKLAKIQDFSPVLRSAERIKKKWQKHVEIITLVIPTMNDDDLQLKGIADWMMKNLGTETPWHLTRFSPYLEFSHLPPTPVATLEKARAIGQKAGLKFVYLGNVLGHPAESTYCPKCQHLLIERAGYQIGLKGLKNNCCANCDQLISGVFTR